MDPSLRTILCHLKLDWQSVGPALSRCVVAAVVGLLPILTLNIGLSEAIEPTLLRGWFALRGKREVPHSVSVVRIDKSAYAKIGLSPGEMFPRNYMAEALERITAAGAKLIVIDAVAQRPGDPKVDQQFAKALANTPTVIARSTELVVETDVNGNKQTRRLLNKPIELFAQNSKAVIPMEVRLTRGISEQISLANERDATADVNVPLLEPLRRFVSPEIESPGGFDFINFYGPPSSIPNTSIGNLIGSEAKIPEEYFKNRVVFIGAQSDSGTGVEAGKDSFLTPVSRKWMFGVEIHATIAANLIDHSWLRRLTPQKEALIMGVFGFIVAYIVCSMGMLAGFGVTLVAISLWLGTSYYFFLKRTSFIPGLTMVGILTLLLVARWGLSAFRSSKKR